MSSVSYQKATAEADYSARKITLGGYSGSFKVTGDANGAYAGTSAALLEAIETYVDADISGQNAIHESGEVAAYVFNDASDLSSFSGVTFTAENDAATEQAKVTFNVLQDNQEQYVAQLDINSLKSNFAIGDSWSMTVEGTAQTFTLKDDGSGAVDFADMLAQLNALFNVAGTTGDYTFSLGTGNNTLSVVKGDNGSFSLADLILKEVPTASTTESTTHFDTFAKDFSTVTPSSGTVLSITIDGVTLAQETIYAPAGETEGDLDAALANLVSKINDSSLQQDFGYNDAVLNGQTITISGLNGARVGVSSSLVGANGLLDLDGISEQKNFLYNFGYHGVPWVYAGEIQLDSNQYAITNGSAYEVKTPYLVLFQEVDASVDISGDISALAATLDQEAQAAFINHMNSVQAEASIDGKKLKPVKVVQSSDAYLEYQFLNAGNYVVEVGHVTSVVYEQDTSVITQNYREVTDQHGNVYYESYETSKLYDTDTGPYVYGWHGVAGGSVYDLNISIQAHDLSLDNQSLDERLIRIT
ncbi:MAG: hypothetical protein ACPH5V_07055, partial [Alcanivorax sp.]